MKKVRFMEDRVGEEFAALVLNPPNTASSSS